MTTSSGHMSLTQKKEEAVRTPSQPARKAYEYFEDIKVEFAKISWTSPEKY